MLWVRALISTSRLQLLLALSVLALTAIPSGRQNTLAPTIGTGPGSSHRADVDRLVDVGAHRMHVTCTGNGSPTVILEAGLGGTSRTWAKVVPELRTFAPGC